MVLKVELLSKEMMIKPSSPTPPHLKTFKLSFLDQISSPFFIPLIFFFHHAADDDHGRSSQLLKQSLSKVLTLFYPLAGRINGNDFIDCSDGGALWVEARVHGFLKDVVENPLMEELKKFIPVETYYNGDDGQLILAVQINYFLDGGIAVGVRMLHKIGDGLSLVKFVNAWALTAREGDAAAGEISPPNFGLVSSLFPPTTMDLPRFGFSPSLGVAREKIVTKRVVFDKEKLAALKKSAAAESSRVGDPTRVEALSAFLWKRFRESFTKKPQRAAVKKTFRASHSVSLRARMNPPLPDATFGNLWSLTTTSETTQDDDDDLVFQLRTAIRKINAEYAEALQNGKGHSERLRIWHEMLGNEETAFCKFTSWCGFPIYEVDFGWGKPVWACTVTIPYKNIIILMNTKCGDGIEAWINMGEDDIWELA